MKPVKCKAWVVVAKDDGEFRFDDDGGISIIERTRPVLAFDFLRAERVEVTIKPIKKRSVKESRR